MRILKQLIFLLFLVSGPSIFAQNLDVQADSFGRIFVNSVSQSDFTQLKAAMLPGELWGKYGAKWDSLPAEQKAKILTDSEERLQSDFKQLLNNAEENKIKLKKLVYDGVVSEANPEFEGTGGSELIGMQIFFLYNGKRDSFAVAALKGGGCLYLTEILMTTNVFDDVK